MPARRAWYNGLELAFALALLSGLAGDWWYDSGFLTLLSVGVGFGVGYVLQRLN